MLIILVKILLLVGLVRLLQITDSPGICSLLYATAIGLMLLNGNDFLPDKDMALPIAITFSVALLYFWLLSKTEGTIIYFLILFGGAAISLV